MKKKKKTPRDKARRIDKDYLKNLAQLYNPLQKPATRKGGDK